MGIMDGEDNIHRKISTGDLEMDDSEEKVSMVPGVGSRVSSGATTRFGLAGL
jgi:hypothetical protein